MLANTILLSLFTTVMFVIGLLPFASKLGLTDHPCHRKQHKKPTPLIGGLAVYFAIVTMFIMTDFEFAHKSAYLAAASLLVMVGLMDDRQGLGVKIRIVAQLCAGLIMTVYADIKITNLGNIFFIGDVDLGYFATIFTLFAVVGGINAFNMIDGIDGLAGSLTLVSMIGIAIVTWIGDSQGLLTMSGILIGTLLGFLAFNLRIFGRCNALIFLGDTGSTLYGFTVCWLAIDSAQGPTAIIAPSTVLWLIAIPLFDSVCIMLRRIAKGKSPFNPDREHLHHIMALTGYSVNSIVLRLSSYGLAMVCMGLLMDLVLGLPDGIGLLAFLLLFTCHYLGMDHAWNILKITRFLRTRRKMKEGIEFRRVNERRQNNEAFNTEEQRSPQKQRRAQKERRFIPTDAQLGKFYLYEEKMTNPDYQKTWIDKLSIFWLNLYIGSK